MMNISYQNSNTLSLQTQELDENSGLTLRIDSQK